MTRRVAGGSSRWISIFVGLFITLACLVYLAHKVDFNEVSTAFTQFEWHFLFVGLTSLALGYSVRILRWSLILNAAGSKVKFRQCAAPFLGSIAINNVLPLRAGDLTRALVFPASIGVQRTVATSSLIMERLIDLMSLLLWLAVSLYIGGSVATPAWVKDTTFFLAGFGSVALIGIFAFSGAISRSLAGSANTLVATVAELLHGFDAMSRLPVLLSVFALSLLVWIGEAGLFYSLLLGFRFTATPPAAMTIMAIATLATLVPSSPGYVGPFHIAAFAGISLLGGTNEQAASFAVLSHLGLWLPTTVAGVLAIASAPAMFKGLRRSRD